MSDLKIEKDREYEVQIYIDFLLNRDEDVSYFRKSLPDIVRIKKFAEIQLKPWPIPRATVVTVYSRAENWSSSIDIHWASIKRQLEDHWNIYERLIELKEHIYVTIYVDHFNNFPLVWIDPEMLKFLARMDAKVSLSVNDGAYEEGCQKNTT